MGGIVLKPGLESRPDSPLDPLLPREEGRLSLSLLSPESLSFLSRGGMMGLEGEGSLPILLHVWASRARGLFLASSCERQKNKTHITQVPNEGTKKTFRQKE